jgi:hypothetical protein
VLRIELPTTEQHGRELGSCRPQFNLSPARASLLGRSLLDVNTSSVAGLFHLVRPRSSSDMGRGY